MKNDCIRFSIIDDGSCLIKELYFTEESDNNKQIEELILFLDSADCKSGLEYALIIDKYKRVK
jgi:hypothetical protein